MFLLVPAHPGFPGQIPQSRKTVVCVCVCVQHMLLSLFCTIMVAALWLVCGRTVHVWTAVCFTVHYAYLISLSTTLACEVMQSPPSVRLFPVHSFEPNDLWPWCFARVCGSLLSCTGLKLKVTGQGRDTVGLTLILDQGRFSNCLLVLAVCSFTPCHSVCLRYCFHPLLMYLSCICRWICCTALAVLRALFPYFSRRSSMLFSDVNLWCTTIQCIARALFILPVACASAAYQQFHTLSAQLWPVALC